MLEIVPQGVDKWAGMTLLLRHMGVAREELMAVRIHPSIHRAHACMQARLCCCALHGIAAPHM